MADRDGYGCGLYMKRKWVEICILNKLLTSSVASQAGK
jgi:hypothetical protein